MLHSIIVVFERTACVVGRINEDTLYLSSKLLFERLESEQIVAVDEPVIKNVAIADAMRRVIRLRRIFEQDARFQLRPVLLPDPGQFQLLLSRHLGTIIRAAMPLAARQAAAVEVVQANRRRL